MPVAKILPYSFYQPLDTLREEIRLIRILPALSNDETIQCKLETAFLSTSSLAHAALSYVWGDPAITRDIHINGEPFPVTENLHDALWHFRSNRALLSEDHDLELPLWVDAICINQGDISERNQQIPFMSSIYSSATRVISWVGTPGVEEGDIAIHIMRSMVKSAFSDNEDEINEKGLRDFLISQPFLFQRDDQEEIYFYAENAAWRTINRFYSRPYWHRLWIFQETILARSASTHLLVCGPETIAFDDAVKFSRVVEFLTMSNIPEQLGFNQQIWNLVKKASVLTILRVVAWGRSALAGGVKLSPTNILLLSLLFEATDPRDYVYGFHALSVLSQKVDYNRSKKEVYLDWYNTTVGTTLVAGESHRAPILLAGLGLDESWEPSWLPNLSRLREISPESYLGKLMSSIKYGSCNPIHSHSNDIASEVRGDSLYISGVRCGKVTDVFNIHASGPPCGRLHQLCFDFLTRDNQTDHPRGMSALQALFYLIHQGHDPETNQRLSVPPKPTSAFQAFRWQACVNLNFGYEAAFAGEEIEYERCVAEYGPKWKQGKFGTYQELVRRLDESICEGVIGCDDFQTLRYSRPSETFVINERALELADLKVLGLGRYGRGKFGLPDTLIIEDVIGGGTEKVMFQTDEGHIGFGLEGLREGDQVCTLKNVSSPVVLREKGERYRNVGLCYVYGLWDDGAADTIKPGDPRLKVFEIY